MSAGPFPNVVVTGLGMVTPLGNRPGEILRRMRAGQRAAGPPTRFDASPFACRVCAEVRDFDASHYVAEPKMLRLMNRDAQLALAGARLALGDAGVKSGADYLPEEIGLYGAAGLAGLPLKEVAPLLRASAGTSGEFDLARFGGAGLKSVSPLLSFKILGNMPLCFVSINEGIEGPNAIYTPWEGAGAQAVEAAIRALQSGEARCALVGGSDVKTHELAFVSLQQLGLFGTEMSAQCSASTPGGCAGEGAGAPSEGLVPAEGAAFLVLETEEGARARGARIYAQIAGFSLRAECAGESQGETRMKVLRELAGSANSSAGRNFDGVVSSENGVLCRGAEQNLFASADIAGSATVAPKQHLGDMFAAAAPLQLGIGAALICPEVSRVLVNCFGYGSTQAAFVLGAMPPGRSGQRPSE